MYAILAEKPSAAKAFAQALNGKKQGRIYVAPPPSLLPEGALICATVGHILEFLEPSELDEKYTSYSLDSLPIIIDNFQYKVVSDKKEVLQTIKNTIFDKRVKTIILATDAASEGEYI
ncbi:toprim domain-containing protein [Alkalihalophilus marmarensis]|uniref:toprim domain-containing protein n=1 Tax=Alkalihalophilus marmarensis TaxID=521377 RepID=UPI002DB9B81B|nr:toprim domain-containing protein [Alkalihalophilus marmarensis]MEC2074386.1 toprim domain-containing protein [Alkalihalophilus marmarensis]